MILLNKIKINCYQYVLFFIKDIENHYILSNSYFF